MSSLTTREYWESGYRQRLQLLPEKSQGFKNYPSYKILKIKESVGFEGKRILEIGGGGSSWLAYLAERYRSSTFTALDYSEEGCSQISNYANDNKLSNLNVLCGDVFDETLTNEKYDVVYSHGVVEHFTDLSSTLAEFAKYLDVDGRLITFIPNMSGLNGFLTKFFNREVFDIHVPHDRESFVRGHEQAGLKILEAGYLCSSNFGVLSSCFTKEETWKWFLFMQLTRVSKIIWAFEYRFFDLPLSRTFSPYIYAIAKKS